MKYYLVAVASTRYHGDEPLTYAHDGELESGVIVQIPLQRTKALGFVIAETPKPAFAVKPILQLYQAIPPLPQPTIQLFSWMLDYYPAPLGITTQLFLPKDLPARQSTTRTPEAVIPASQTLPPLTADQTEAVHLMKSPGPYLLHGETGSGKTRVYIELARQVVAEGKSCIILTPEISLTSQLASAFAVAFKPHELHVIHSQLTPAARRKHWLELAKGERPHVVIGPRSALFSPLPSIGLIVIDESHEFTYKQENAPYYHASRVAAKLASLHGARLVLGSATPSVQDYYLFEQLKHPIIRLASPAIAHATHNTVNVTTVDMRDKANLSTTAHFSHELVSQMKYSLDHGRQVLLFLNRRGTARLMLCDSCGWQALCPHCDLPLTYHHDSHSLRCHACSYRSMAVSSCPDCSNTDITLKSIGTKAILANMQKLFPAAKTARFDADNIKGERINELYQEVREGAIDILIGTQLLAKGLDLPRLGLVGLINADGSLYIPDFTAQERTYQMIYQLIGRVGRGHQAGFVVIQTYTPDNPTIQAAAAKDWQLFYRSELMERNQFLFPPFVYVLKASCKRVKSETAMHAAQKTAAALRTAGLQVLVEGPAPAFHEKAGGKYVWQLIVKSKHRSELLRAIKLLPSDWSYDIDPVDLL